MAKKKKKETFKTFRNLEKYKFKTIKTHLLQGGIICCAAKNLNSCVYPL